MNNKLIALLLAAVLVLSGCGSGAATAPVDSSAPAAQDGAAENAAEPEDDPLAELEEKAEAGDVQAMKDLAWLYRGNEGVAKDMEKALVWYERAAEAGDAEAMNTLGWLYQGNEGVEQDVDQAAFWYAKAFEAGNDSAAYSLGFLYEHTLDEPDYGKAAEAYAMGAKAGNHSCINGLTWIYNNINGTVSKSFYEETVLAYNQATKDVIPDPEIIEKPVFHTVDVDGNTVDESVFAGHTLTMVTIWNYSDDEFYLPYLSLLQELEEKYADKGFQIIGVCENNEWDDSGYLQLVSGDEVRAVMGDADITTLLKFRPREDSDYDLMKQGQVEFWSVHNEQCTEILAAFDFGFTPITFFVDGEGRLVHFPKGVEAAVQIFNQITSNVQVSRSSASIYEVIYDNTRLYDGVKQLSEISLMGAPRNDFEPYLDALLNGEGPDEEDLAWWDSLHHDSELEWWGKLRYKG